MKVSTKLKLNSLAVLVFLSLNIVIAVILIRGMTVGMSQLIEVSESLNEATLEMEINTIETAQAVLDYIQRHEERDIERMYDSKRDFRQFADKFERLAVTQGEQELGRKIIDLYGEFETLGGEIISTSKQRHTNLRVIHKAVIDIDNLIDEKLQPAVDRSAPEAVTKLEDVLEMETNIAEAFVAIESYALEPNPELLKKVIDSKENFQRFETQYRGTGLSAEEDKWLDQIDKDFAEAMTTGIEIFTLTDLLHKKLNKFEGDLEEIDRLLDEEVQILIREETALAEDKVRRSGEIAIISLFVIGFFVIAVVAFVGWFVSKGIIDATNRLTEGAEELTRGNLDHRIEVKKDDELGLLADTFNKIAQSRKKAEDEQKRLFTVVEAKNQQLTANEQQLRASNQQLQSEITERKQAQKMRTLLMEAIEQANEIVIITDIDGTIQYVNPAFERITGYPRQEAIGQNPRILKSGKQDDAFYKDMWDTLLGGETWTGEFINKKKDGTLYTEEATISFVRNAEGKTTNYVGVKHDITERKRTEEQLEITKERAEAANIAKSQFLANMSHEIRTPMSIITGFSDILINEELTTDQLKSAELIRNAGKSLLTIINDILDYSKIEAGKLKVVPADFSLKTILDDVDNVMRPLAVKKKLPFEIICGETLPAIIQTDKGRLHQCLVNLVGNAIKFTQQGHVHLKVFPEDKDNKPFIRFDVEDTGIGVPPDMREHIFDSFAQIEKGSTRKHGGTGLGLTITSQLAHLLGGELSFTSDEGAGSTFSLVIPAGIHVTSLPSLEKEKAVREVIPAKEELRLYSGSVLVAEDNTACQSLSRKIFGRLGLKVTIAGNGKEAIEKTLNESFDLIFMDVRMPHLDGFQATEALHQKGITIPIIALTAHAMEGDRELCIQAGCDGYLSKPIEHEKLLKILDRYLPAKQLT